jgi:8-oxo-dGTP pyrophosphatase MutT (NUDIX family)
MEARIIEFLKEKLSTLKAKRSTLRSQCDLCSNEPPYCCVILQSPNGALLMESRGAKASVAANKLVCFGGKRELGENPNLCIRRECKEEMNFVPKSMTRSTDLFVDGKLIAYFYIAAAPTPSEFDSLVFEETRGNTGVWVTDIEDAHISPWHKEVLKAWKKGLRRADFSSQD